MAIKENKPEKGKPPERVGRKATGLSLADTGYGSRVARRDSTSRVLDFAGLDQLEVLDEILAHSARLV